MTYRLDFTRRFTSGLLVGLTHDDSITFVSEESALEWLEAGMKGFDSPVAGDPYRVVASNLVPMENLQ